MSGKKEDIDTKLAYEPAIDYTDKEFPINHRRFVYNEQLANVTCICGNELEVYNNMTTNCSCGRQHELSTRLLVRWATPLMSNFPNHNQNPEEAETEHDTDSVEPT